MNIAIFDLFLYLVTILIEDLRWNALVQLKIGWRTLCVELGWGRHTLQAYLNSIVVCHTGWLLMSKFSAQFFLQPFYFSSWLVVNVQNYLQFSHNVTTNCVVIITITSNTINTNMNTNANANTKYCC